MEVWEQRETVKAWRSLSDSVSQIKPDASSIHLCSDTVCLCVRVSLKNPISRRDLLPRKRPDDLNYQVFILFLFFFPSFISQNKQSGSASSGEFETHQTKNQLLFVSPQRRFIPPKITSQPRCVCDECVIDTEPTEAVCSGVSSGHGAVELLAATQPGLYRSVYGCETGVIELFVLSSAGFLYICVCVCL